MSRPISVETGPIVVVIAIDVTPAERDTLAEAIGRFVATEMADVPGFDRSWLCARDGGLVNFARWHDAAHYEQYLQSAQSARIQSVLSHWARDVRREVLSSIAVGAGPWWPPSAPG